jgi:hypothetical protein
MPASFSHISLITHWRVLPLQGFYGECGLRGGYFEIFNIPADVKAELYKLCSISLCSNTVGQVSALGCSAR